MAKPQQYAFACGTDVELLPDVPPRWELHLSPSPEFTRGPWAKRVRAAGGTYSEARGDARYRFVRLPSTEAKLLDELVQRFSSGRLVACARNVVHNLPAWATVHELVNPSTYASPAAELATRWRRSVQRLAADPRSPVTRWDAKAQAQLERAKASADALALARRVECAVAELVRVAAALPSADARAVLAEARAGVAAVRKATDPAAVADAAGLAARRRVAHAICASGAR